MDKHVIGAVTTYIGSDAAVGECGAKVKVIGILRDGEPEDGPAAVIRDDLHLARVGGVRAGDAADVLIWNESEGRWGWIGTEITDITLLAAFAHLKPTEG